MSDAAGGISKEIVISFVCEGASVAIADPDQDAA